MRLSTTSSASNCIACLPHIQVVVARLVGAPPGALPQGLRNRLMTPTIASQLVQSGDITFMVLLGFKGHIITVITNGLIPLAVPGSSKVVL